MPCQKLTVYWHVEGELQREVSATRVHLCTSLVAIKDRNFDCIRNRPVAETRPEHFFKALSDGKVCVGGARAEVRVIERTGKSDVAVENDKQSQLQAAILDRRAQPMDAKQRERICAQLEDWSRLSMEK